MIDDCAAHRALTVQRALRAAQHFDAIQVEILDRRGSLKIRDTERCIVEVVARSCHRRSGRPRPNLGTRTPCSRRRSRFARRRRESARSDPSPRGFPSRERLARECLNRHRHVAERLLADLRCRNDDLLDPLRSVVGLLCLRGRAAQRGCDRKCYRRTEAPNVVRRLKSIIASPPRNVM